MLRFKQLLPIKIFIDAELLVLLVVGATGEDLISKHRRLRTFQVEDYLRLAGLIESVGDVVVTPNALTEASNLLGQHGEPERSRFFHVLRSLVLRANEVVVASKTATARSEFIRLGLTDAALLEVVSHSNPLVTVDFDLYRAAIAKEEGAAFNFRHFSQ